jgi:hypothetical protein
MFFSLPAVGCSIGALLSAAECRHGHLKSIALLLFGLFPPLAAIWLITHLQFFRMADEPHKTNCEPPAAASPSVGKQNVEGQ